VHGSLLPKYRGAAPIQRAILAGEATTGITIMQMNEKMDAGDLLLQRATEIHADDTSESLGERLAEIGARLLVEALDGVERGTIQPVRQDESQVSFAPLVKKEEGAIDWTRALSRSSARCARSHVAERVHVASGKATEDSPGFGHRGPGVGATGHRGSRSAATSTSPPEGPASLARGPARREARESAPESFSRVDSSRRAILSARAPVEGFGRRVSSTAWRSSHPRSSPRTSVASARKSKPSTRRARLIHVDVMDGHFVPAITIGPSSSGRSGRARGNSSTST